MYLRAVKLLLKAKLQVTDRKACTLKIAIGPLSDLDDQHSRQSVERLLRLAFTRYEPIVWQVRFSSRSTLCPDRQDGYKVSLRISVEGMPDIEIEETQRALGQAIHRVVSRSENLLRQRLSGQRASS